MRHDDDIAIYGKRRRQPAKEERGRGRSRQLGGDESRRIDRAECRRTYREAARANVTAGLAKEVDAVNQYAGSDVGSHCERHGGRATSSASPDHREQTERRHEFTEELGTARAGVARSEEQRFAEHHMSRGDSRQMRPAVCAAM